MTTFPIVDPAEIAKLPHGVYETGLGAMCLSDDGVWTDFAGDRWSHTDLASSGGIAARLVPEASPEEIMAAKRDIDEWEEALLTAEAQRDRTEELLRQAMPGLERGGASEVLGRIDAYFAYRKRENCQRCGDERFVRVPMQRSDEDIDDFKPCPDCQGGAS